MKNILSLILPTGRTTARLHSPNLDRRRDVTMTKLRDGALRFLTLIVLRDEYTPPRKYIRIMMTTTGKPRDLS